MNKRIHISATLRAMLAVLFAFSVVVVATVSVVHATGSGNLPDVAAPAIGDAPNAAELENLQFVANQEGISLQTAIARYGWRDNFSLAVAQVREEVPAAFTKAEIVDDSNAWIAFKANAPQAALDIINTFKNSHSGVSVQIITGKGFTEVELRKVIEAAHYAVYESSEVHSAVTTFDSSTDQINTTAVLDSAASDSVIESLKATAKTNLTNATRADILSSISVTVVRSEHLVLGGNDSNPEHMGGEVLKDYNGDKNECTSGFGTITTSQVRGISTAGHCRNSLTDDGLLLTHHGEHEGTHGDFQWHTGPDTETDDFYGGSSTKTETNKFDVAAVGAPEVGDYLCRNGLVSHRDCQTVRKVDVCKDNLCNLVQMGARLSAPLDSGGPVYWGSTAYGLHQGWMWDPWPFKRDVFSRADRIDDALGYVYIATE